MAITIFHQNLIDFLTFCARTACARPDLVFDHASQAGPMELMAYQLHGLGLSEVSCCGVVMVVADGV